MNNILEQIVIRKRERLAEAKKHMPLAELIATMPTSVGAGRFVRPLRRAGIQIIAEIKRQSPSRGVLRENIDPGNIARNYTANGAAAISVLTEEDFFAGSFDDMRKVRQVTDRPLLQKDFIFDEYQVYQAAFAEADAILLIASILSDSQLNDLLQAAYTLGLDALVEIHRREELDKVMKHHVQLLGVNNRDLHTFETRLETSIELAGDLPKSVTLVSESGIRTRKDIERLYNAGFHAFLIGEEFMRADDEGKALRTLLER
jgi:indole-3-glycerol phosphate synthase